MASNIPATEWQALFDLFNSTGGASWHWREATTDIPWNFTSSANNPCTNHWQGVTCNRLPPYHVEQLVLSAYNLTGTLPSSLSAFTYINLLDLSHNKITGPLPPSLGGLVALQDLYMDNNQFSGFIPSSLGSLSQVQRMHLGNNLLHGPIPSSIGNMTALRWLTLNYLNLNGTIPATFSQLTNLTNLEIAYQNDQDGPGLSGGIDCLSTLYNLTTLSLEYNSLNGTVPAAFGNLTWLTSLDLDHNFFTGRLPPSLGQLSNLISFYIDHNYLSGHIPPSYGNMTRLKDLYLYSNHLSGPIPETLGNLAELVVFDVNGNRMTGTIPESIANCTKLYTFVANNNKLHGTIPAFFGSYHRLGNLFVGQNQFTGTIPPELGELRNLEYLGLYENQLHGVIPGLLGQLKYLNTLSLYDNSLTGTISANLSMLSHLNDLELNSNLLEGTVPGNFSALSKLSVLRLFGNFLSGNLDGVFDATRQTQLSSIQVNDNKITGSLPAELFLLPKLDTFAATSNCFDGSLPDTVCSAVSLKNLVADGLSSADACKLSLIPGQSDAYTSAHPVHGTIPACVFALPLLTTLHLSGNKLSGSIPTSVVISLTLQDLSLSSNTLTGDIPQVMQTRQWAVNLDLSYNRFGGTLSVDFAAAPSPAAALSLQNNRLSGHIPSSIVAMTNVSVLGSNLFSCALDGSDLPQNDASNHNSVRNYQCGSTAFELWYYLWLGLTVAVLLLVLGAMYGYLRTSVDWAGWLRKCDAPESLLQQQVLADQANPLPQPDLESSSTERASDAHDDSTDKSSTTAPAQTRQVGLLFQELVSIMKLGALCTLFMVVALVPLYAALSVEYGTLVHLYAWNLSSAFLSGKLAFALLVLFLTLLLVFMAVMYNILIYRTDRRERVVEAGKVDDSERMWAKLWLQKAAIWSVFIFINFVVVLGVNIGYVVVAIRQSSTTLIVIQVLLAFFKLAWNNVCAAYLMQKTVQYVHGVDCDTSITISRNAFTSLRIGVTLLNNIVIPCCVVAAIAPACFRNVFASADAVTSSYSYSTCSVISPTSGGCLQYAPQISTSSYHPPFTYNYQCSGSLVTYYAPTFVTLCISNAFVSPLLQIVAVLLYKHAKPETCGGYWERLLKFFVPTILRPVAPLSTDRASTVDNAWLPLWCSPPHKSSTTHLLDGNQLVITLVGYLGLLLTFGAVFPPLAVAVAATIKAVTLYAKFRVGRFLVAAEAEGRDDMIVALDVELQGRHATEVLQYGLWMLLTISCWFYTLFLFDTLGDAVGFERAYWVLIVFPLLPVVLYVCILLVSALRGEETITKGANNGLKSDDFELSVSQGSNSTALQLALASQAASAADGES